MQLESKHNTEKSGIYDRWVVHAALASWHSRWQLVTKGSNMTSKVAKWHLRWQRDIQGGKMTSTEATWHPRRQWRLRWQHDIQGGNMTSTWHPRWQHDVYMTSKVAQWHQGWQHDVQGVYVFIIVRRRYPFHSVNVPHCRPLHSTTITARSDCLLIIT